MFKVSSIALTAALCGLHAQTASAQTAGCFAGWVSGATYSADSRVSANIASTSDVVNTPCTPGTTGCPANAFITTGGVTTTATHNFRCTGTPAFCSQRDPAGNFGSIDWTQEATCSGSAPAPAASIPAAWSGGGCPAAFVGGTDYDPESVVTVDMGTFSLVYQCTSAPNNLFCGQSGYEPGTSQHGAVAWTELGSCMGMLSPTTSPVNVVLQDVGGCPVVYSASAAYDEGDRVSENQLVYQCRGYPQSGHCSQAGFEPGTSAGATAWNIIGVCGGTIGPTSSPSFVSLTAMGACPDGWVAGANNYDEGDRVSANELVFQCKAFPFSGWCGQNGYEPLADNATPDAWRDAWTLLGYCSGSIGPTSAPSFDALASVGACPQEWVMGDQNSYEQDDQVSVTVSTTPIRKVVYRCKSWPNSNFCGVHAPDVFGGDLGWTLAGSCDGSIGPTASPNFDSISFISNPSGCPALFSRSNTHEAGDRVAVSVSTLPVRSVVYECRAFPNVGYCNGQGASLDPGATFGYLGWTLVGACDGTLAPTGAPTAYGGTCTFNRCAPENCIAGAPSNGIAGSTACSCGVGDTQSSSCTARVCTPTDVDPYSTSTTYAVGDVSRRGRQQFRCRVPGWCNQPAYQPLLVPGLWSQAWTMGGMCN